MPQRQYPKIRLFTTSVLKEALAVELSKEQSHYLLNVMRRKEGDLVLLFNGVEGEWLAKISSCGKKQCQLVLQALTKQQTQQPDIWLCFAPVKNAPISNIIQKSTELGVSRLVPVITKHTIVTKINLDRLGSIAIEAAEQSGRISVPTIAAPVSLQELLSAWKGQERKLILCDESGGGLPMSQALLPLAKNGKYAAIVGPEGGFAESEFALLKNQDYVIPVGMGPRVLRADTAAIVALAGIFSILGDWDERPNFRQ